MARLPTKGAAKRNATKSGAIRAGLACRQCGKKLKRTVRGRPRVFCSATCRLRAHRADNVKQASGDDQRSRRADARAAKGVHKELARAHARISELERELAALRLSVTVREPKKAPSHLHTTSGVEATEVAADEKLKRTREAREALGTSFLTAHTVAFERARADAAEARAREAVEAALKLKRERDDAQEAWRASQLQLLEAEKALRRR